MSTIPQNQELLKHLFALLQVHRGIFKQERTYQRVVALVLAELFVFARHTITQMLMSLGQTEQDWSAWYRVLSQKRFKYEQASAVLFGETLKHVAEDEVYVVAGDATQTPRSSRKLEGSGWLRNRRTPPFMVGIHAAQRWFNGSWLVPAEGGYSRAIPIHWQPAFTAKSKPQVHAPRKESEAALDFLNWLREQLRRCGRTTQRILFVGDGHYDSLPLWQGLPEGVILLARSAKNRVLHHLPEPSSGKRGRKRRYGERAATPQMIWQERSGWKALSLWVRGKERHLQVKVRGVLVRKGAADRPLFLIVVRGKDNAHTRREPLPFLVNAWSMPDGSWRLPLPLDTLLFWAWQRWEIEVAHRELKSNFGLGNKQCFNPYAAVASVQWSAWVYALLLLAGYRTFGLTRAPTVPTGWWRGSPRWSLNTLWRTYRAAFWQQHDFHPLFAPSPPDWGEKEPLLLALRNAVFAAARS
ncbi:MAG: hypothetical protein BroJett038_22830 [Chloroflexota bacterium]|nr:MAG: hypothetical protein BroJett038_22830 [Chloroflexota bacterium]